MSSADIYKEKNNYLLKTRTIYLYGEIDVDASYEVISRLKLLDFVDSSKKITIEINSPGGDVSAGLAIIDTINIISAPVETVVCGLAASMAALILASGSKGLRKALPHSTIMIHQPLGGFGFSQASDIEIYAKNILKTKHTLNEILSHVCNRPLEEVERDTDRDYYMSSDEALAYGMIDEVIKYRKR